jgi:hypothetical protein
MKKLLLSLVTGALLATNAIASPKPVDRVIYKMPKESLSTQEVKDLLHMREEEKLARDVYLTLYSKWHMPIFKNIARSESWHMHMIKVLLNKYRLKDPVVSNKVGAFSNPELKKLYNELVAKGEKSRIDALKVGATVEDLDIYDLDKAIKDTDNKDIKFVYERLRMGSTNHMRAFVGLLRRYGSDYSPQYISKAEYQAILNGSTLLDKDEIKGEVLKVYTLPGLRRGVYWWMADVKTNNGIIKVAIAPTWVLKNVNIKPGDKIEVKGYQGLYSFVACKIEDETTHFEYKSRSFRCK